ncbi:MAG: HD domain-containing protein [Thermoanaerobaculia bacterium]
MTRRKTPFTNRFAEAFAYAIELHGDQTRKHKKGERPIPYVAHLMSVAALVLEHGGDEKEAIAALLHDGPEDRGGQETLETIERKFGSAVARIVLGCSDTLEAKKPEWRKRKEDYIEHLKSNKNSSIFLVSLADKVHNLRSILEDYRHIGDDLWERFTGNRAGTLWYYGALLEIYEHKAPKKCAGLIAEMRRIYRQILTEALE